MLSVAIAVFVVGVAVAIAVPRVQQAVWKRRATKVAEELRAFATAFQAHAAQHGEWPAATQRPGEVPPGMEAALGAQWSGRSAVGLRYLWAPDSLQRGRRFRAAIVLWRDYPRPHGEERWLLEEIDRLIDDGDLLGGRFQIGHRDQPFFALET